MPGPIKLSSDQAKETQLFTSKDAQSDFQPENKTKYLGLAVAVDRTPKKTQSFFTRLSTFFTGLFGRNRELRVQRTAAPASLGPASKMAEAECHPLQIFGKARTDILSRYAAIYQAKLGNPELQKFRKSMPAIIANFDKDFTDNFYKLRSTATCRELPTSHALYQSHGATAIRSNNSAACVQDFARFIEQKDISKAFESWLYPYTRIPMPDIPRSPILESICCKLNHADANALTNFLDVSNKALLRTIEDYPQPFREALHFNPTLFSETVACSIFHEKYLERFCVAFEKFRILSEGKCAPLGWLIHLRIAHDLAISEVLMPHAESLGKPVFSRLEKLIAEKSDVGLARKPAQDWIRRYVA
jgi:hypothetical protein